MPIGIDCQGAFGVVSQFRREQNPIAAMPESCHEYGMAKSGKNKPPNGPPGKYEMSAGAAEVQAELRMHTQNQPKEGLSWQRLLVEIPVIAKAPYSFFSLSFLIGAIGVCALWYLGLLVPGVIVTGLNTDISNLNGQIQTLEQRIKQKDELIADVRGKLDNVPVDSIVAEVEKLKANLTQLQSRKADVLEATVSKNSDGTYTIYRKVSVRAYSTPNYFYITVQSNGLVDVKVTATNQGMVLQGRVRPNPNMWVERITNPVGIYNITILTAASEANIAYKFE